MTIYREYSHKIERFQYFVHVDGRRVYMAPTWAVREVCRGARLVMLR